MGRPSLSYYLLPPANRTELNIVAVFKTGTYSQKSDPEAHKAELQKTYRNTHPEMQAVLGLMDLTRRWPLADREPIRHWAKGRVMLLGTRRTQRSNLWPKAPAWRLKTPSIWPPCSM